MVTKLLPFFFYIKFVLIKQMIMTTLILKERHFILKLRNVKCRNARMLNKKYLDFLEIRQVKIKI